MLHLKSERDGTLFRLLPGKTHKINRKEGDLVLTDDLSISRNHSAILLSQDGEIFLWDEGSKYGTFILNGQAEQRLTVKERTKIKVGDRLRFGVQWNVFMLCKTDFVVCTSTLCLEDKKTLLRILQKLGGRLKSNWDDECTHLTMNQVSLTHKVVFALAEGKPIVSLKFWQKMEEAVGNHSELPKIEDHQPPIEEEELKKQTKSDTLLPSKDRKNLFRGMIFVFSTEDSKNKLKPLVECAGGICMSIQSSKLSAKQCCETNYVVIKDGEASGQPMRDIFSTLKQKGLRAVEVSEIGLAIYNKSLVRYCNTSWSKPVILGRSPSQSQGICLVENTEDILKDTQDIKAKPNSSLVIPQSLESNISVDSSRSAKRPPSPTDNRPTKRPNQKQGSLQNWLKRSETKDSEATMSFGYSAGDMACSSRNLKPAVPSPKKSNGVRKEESRNEKQEGDDPFKLPSPKKSSSVKKDLKVPSPKKRGRVESDPSELPAPKKSATADRTLDPFEESIEDHSDEEIEKPRKRAVIEEDSDDEFPVPALGKRNARRVDEKSRKRAVIEEDSDDEFPVPASGKRNARRADEKSRKRAATIEEDSDDEFRIPESGKRNARRVDEKSRKRAAAIEDDSDDEFPVPDSGERNARRVDEKSRKRAVIEEDSDDEFRIPESGKRNPRTSGEEDPPCKPAASRKTVPEGRPSTSRQVERPLQPLRINGTSVSTSNGPSGASLSATGVILHTPSITEFIDKSVGVVFKKEETFHPEEEEELSKYLNKINIVETSLMRQRQRPAPRIEQTESIITDGVPNFKKFKKATVRIPRRITNLVLDQTLKLYVGVPEPDPDVPATRKPARREPARREREPEDSQDLFPSTNRPIPENRRNRRQDQIVDEWTV